MTDQNYTKRGALREKIYCGRKGQDMQKNLDGNFSIYGSRWKTRFDMKKEANIYIANDIYNTSMC